MLVLDIPAGQTLHLKVLYLDMEKNYDFLRIYDGDKTRVPKAQLWAATAMWNFTGQAFEQQSMPQVVIIPGSSNSIKCERSHLHQLMCPHDSAVAGPAVPG